MNKKKKYLWCIGLIVFCTLFIMVNSKQWVALAGNDSRELIDYTTPGETTYYDLDYYDADHLFKAAGSFHLFASEKIELGAHCNGNVAAPIVNGSHAFGNNQAAASGVRELTYVGKLNTSASRIASKDLVLDKENNTVTDMNENPLLCGPLSQNQVKINGNNKDLDNDQRIYLASEDFIDFEKEFKYLGEVSKALSEMAVTLKEADKSSSSQEGTYSLSDFNSAYIHLSDGVNVLNCKASDVSNAGSLSIKGMLCNGKKEEANRFSDTQSLIINVDCSGSGDSVSPGLETKYYCKCGLWPEEHGESNYYPGTIVIWNFYDSSKADSLYTGKISPSKPFDGCLLVPGGDISTTQNTNGTLIAKNISIGGESHRADFKGKKPDLKLTDTEPAEEPAGKPTQEPAEEPAEEPTEEPTEEPAGKPVPGVDSSAEPSAEPDANPTDEPFAISPTENSSAGSQQGETVQSGQPSDTQTASPAIDTLVNQGAAQTPSGQSNTGDTNNGTNSKNNTENTTKKGNLIITVTDSRTGSVVPNAKVKITGPNGKTKTYTTNVNGQIKIRKTAVGSYTVVVAKVPEGYQANRTKFTAKVKAGATTKERVKIRTESESLSKKSGTSSGVSSGAHTRQPETGDKFNIWVAIVLFLFAFVGIIAAWIMKKRSCDH